MRLRVSVMPDEQCDIKNFVDWIISIADGDDFADENCEIYVQIQYVNLM